MTAIRHKGFTLAEVLVASTISAFIAMVAVGALKTVTDSAAVVTRASESTAEVRFAARMLARDLANLYRTTDPRNMKLVGASQGSAAGGPPYLTFYTVGRAKARAEQPEGDVYEVEYMLGNLYQEEEAADPEAESMVLFRRLWPNPDEERSPGGVLTAIAEKISIFDVRFYDGEQWADEWPEEMDSIPELIEVTLGLLPEGRDEPIIESFVAIGVRSSETGATSSEDDEGRGGESNEDASNSRSSGPQNNAGPTNAR